MEEDHKLYEVDKAIIVGVIDPEDMFFHLVNLFLWQSLHIQRISTHRLQDWHANPQKQKQKIQANQRKAPGTSSY